MDIFKPLWEGLTRSGRKVAIVRYNTEFPRPFTVIFLDADDNCFRVCKNGRYWEDGRYNNDLMKFPKDFDAYLKKQGTIDIPDFRIEARKDAIMECNKVAIAFMAAEKKAESRGAQKCVERLTALLKGKTPTKVNRPKQAKASIVKKK